MNIASRFRTWWKAITRREQLNGEIEDEEEVLNLMLEDAAERATDQGDDGDDAAVAAFEKAMKAAQVPNPPRLL